MKMGFVSLSAGLLLLAPGPALPHGSLEEPIHALTHRLADDPVDARILWQRGELHRLEGRWEQAAADLERAARLAPDLAPAHLSLALLRGETGDAPGSLAAAERSLALDPANPRAHLARSRALSALGRRAEAAAELTVVVRELPRPEHYLERARLTDSIGEAIRGLDEGIHRLGISPALALLAIDFEVGRGRHEAALSRLDRLAPIYARQEEILARRGDILQHAGRTMEARVAYSESLDAIAELPAHHRGTPAVQDLESRVRDALRSRP